MVARNALETYSGMLPGTTGSYRRVADGVKPVTRSADIDHREKTALLRAIGTFVKHTNMQRVLLTLFLGAAAAFAPPARTLTSRTALGVNPIDIYSAAEDCLQEECSVDTVPRSAEHHHHFRDLDRRA